MKNYLTVFLVAVCLLSCNKNEELIVLHYNESGCSNPWNISTDSYAGISNSDPEYESKVRFYLESTGLDIQTISVSDDGPISGCFSCGCSTGRRINISICEKDLNLALAIGFYPSEQ